MLESFVRVVNAPAHSSDVYETMMQHAHHIIGKTFVVWAPQTFDLFPRAHRSIVALLDSFLCKVHYRGASVNTSLASAMVLGNGGRGGEPWPYPRI